MVCIIDGAYYTILFLGSISLSNKYIVAPVKQRTNFYDTNYSSRTSYPNYHNPWLLRAFVNSWFVLVAAKQSTHGNTGKKNLGGCFLSARWPFTAYFFHQKQLAKRVITCCRACSILFIKRIFLSKENIVPGPVMVAYGGVNCVQQLVSY
jgi:hypothetical protein